MKGANKIVINQATIKEALQDYFTKIYAKEFVPVVKDVATKPGDSFNGDTYEISVEDTE